MELARSIDEFFAASFDPERWPATLDSLARLTGAESGTLVFDHSAIAQPGRIAGGATIAEELHEYFYERDVPDPRQDRVRPSQSDGFVTDYDHFSPDAIAREPYYQDFLRPRGFGWHAVALLRHGSVAATLSLKRRLHQGPFGGTEVGELNRILPYLRRAGAAAAAVHGGMMRDQLTAFAQVGLGAVTLDRFGRRLAVNDLVGFGDGLELAGDELRASHRGDQDALAAAIGMALRPERPSERPPPPLVRLRRRSGWRPLIVEVLPVIGQPALSLVEVAAIVVVTDLDRATRPELGVLRHAFGLTPREAELAAHLAGGESLDAAAAALGITREHARQRLKAVFRKTDTHRQAELVALLARLRRI